MQTVWGENRMIAPVSLVRSAFARCAIVRGNADSQLRTGLRRDSIGLCRSEQFNGMRLAARAFARCTVKLGTARPTADAIRAQIVLRGADGIEGTNLRWPYHVVRMAAFCHAR